MNNRLALLRNAAKIFHRHKQHTRQLHTEQIYPYPFKYFNETIYPSQTLYRETIVPPPWHAKQKVWATWSMRLFWTFFFYQLFSDPGVIFGHFHPPDPSQWTDAELGIPPDDVGTYEQWLAKKEESGS